MDSPADNMKKLGRVGIIDNNDIGVINAPVAANPVMSPTSMFPFFPTNKFENTNGTS
jgi:hypothetical protein